MLKVKLSTDSTIRKEFFLWGRKGRGISNGQWSRIICGDQVSKLHTINFLPQGRRASQLAQWWKNPPANAGATRDSCLIPGSGRLGGGGNGNPLQYSGLENPLDRGAWWATVQRVEESWTWLKRLSTQACQYSCLKNSMDRGAWWSTVHGVTRSRTRLSTQSVQKRSKGRWDAGLPKRCWSKGPSDVFKVPETQEREAKRDWGGMTMSIHLTLPHSALTN